MLSVHCNFKAYIHQAYDRLNDKRSAFGKHALRIVKEFFEASGMSREQIQSYSLWAARAAGPGICRDPIPQDSDLKKDDAGYKV